MIGLRIVVAVVLMATIGGIASAQTARQRIGREGAVVHNAYGLAKWRTARSVNNNTEPGDSFLFTVLVRPGERLTVAVYLHARELRRHGDFEYVPVGQEQKVSTTALGREWGYQSQTLRSAGAWSMIDNPHAEEKDVPVHVFVPYAIIGLDDGAYRFRYLVRVIDRSNGAVLDSFYAGVEYDAIARAGAYREIRSIAADQVPFKTFEFEGALDDVQP